MIPKVAMKMRVFRSKPVMIGLLLERPPREHTHLDWFGSSLILSLSCRRCSSNAPFYGLLSLTADNEDSNRCAIVMRGCVGGRFPVSPDRFRRRCTSTA